MSVFLKIREDKVLFSGNNFFAIRDSFPVSPGHTLIISKREKSDYFALSKDEQIELTEMINKTKINIEREFNPKGYNIGMNCGIVAGQTIMHFHCHVIPRYKGDMEDPRGGVRHCVEGKGYY